MKLNKKDKILCVCNEGVNRSKYLAKYLRNKGYKTKYGGLGEFSINPIHQISIDWADVIIVVRKKFLPVLKKKFKIKGKKIIVLDVIDSPLSLPKEHEHLRLPDYIHFQRKWTYPHLRKAIKPYLT
ncbi:MAG: hypothetical protein QXI33_01365 [Candidatus Pacearchaeota archaeon]